MAPPSELVRRKVAEAINRGRELYHRATEARRRGFRDLAEKGFDDTVTFCGEAIRIDPSHAPAYLLRAQAYEQLGDDDRAQDDLTKVDQLEGNSE